MKPHERLQKARENAGYPTATAAAEAFGWPVSTYLGHENGSRGFRTEAAHRYARAFGVSWTWLMGGAEGDNLQEVVDLLTAIPVVGVLDPEAYRRPGFKLEGIPAEIHMEVFGYTPEELQAFVVYGSMNKDQHFVIATKFGTSSIVEGDEIVVRRAEGDLIEVAAWRITKNEGSAPGLRYSLVPAYAPHVSMAPQPLEILNDNDAMVLGVVVAELRIKRRKIWPKEEDE
jgi:hypothetical protein